MAGGFILDWTVELTGINQFYDIRFKNMHLKYVYDLPNQRFPRLFLHVLHSWWSICSRDNPHISSGSGCGAYGDGEHEIKPRENHPYDRCGHLSAYDAHSWHLLGLP